MVTMIVTLGPILYTPHGVTVTVDKYFCKALPVILIPVKLLQHIDKLPVLTQALGNRA